MKKYDIAILGATGTVGQSMMEILSELEFPVNNLFPLASHRSAGEKVLFNGQSLAVQDVEKFDFSKVQIALFSAGASVSAKYAPIAANKGCVVIDNTSQFRNENDIPLVITEVNPGDIAQYKNKNIIANPNCSTMQMLVALKPIYDAVGISRINVATYQSVSGTGKAAIDELAKQTQDLLSGRPTSSEVYPIQIAFNVIPHIDVFEPNGYTREEMKMVRETKKILHDSDIVVNPTAVRVPVFYGHSEALHIETKQKISANQARDLLKNAPGIIVKDDPENKGYPSPAVEASGTNPVYVGRIREDISHPLGLNLWVVSDNIRKGAALNSVQIAQILVRDYL
ncbi:MAG: aspartate-semialdehyde dehydrogenase [Proteobacteria bacterium]|nr:aspartate-semialdehyde dehydrogenase [Pseudomonadota bacterium]